MHLPTAEGVNCWHTNPSSSPAWATTPVKSAVPVLFTVSVKATSSPEDDFPSPSLSEDAVSLPSRVRAIRCLEGRSTEALSVKFPSLPEGFRTLHWKSTSICRKGNVFGFQGVRVYGRGLVRIDFARPSAHLDWCPWTRLLIQAMVQHRLLGKITLH